MAAPAISAVMAAIDVRLATVAGLRHTPYVPDQINPPVAWVEIPTIPNYHGTFAHGKMSLDFTVVVAASGADDRVGQAKLAGYADPASATSIHQAIEGDKTLGGIVDDCIVVSFRPLTVTKGVLAFYGGEFILHVISAGV